VLSVDYQGGKETCLAIQLSKCVWVSVDDEQVEADGRGCDSAWDGMDAKFPATGRCVRCGSKKGEGRRGNGGRGMKERERSR
jgi:hypothetical protein